MPIYVSLVKFTEQGIATMEEKGVARSKVVQRNVESLGGRLIEAYYCLGEYDVVAILEFPDNQTAMKAALLNSSLGHIKITTMPAVSRDEWRTLIRDIWVKVPKLKQDKSRKPPPYEKEVERLAMEVVDVYDEMQLASESGSTFEDIQKAKAMGASVIGKYLTLKKRLRPEDKKVVEKTIGPTIEQIKMGFRQLKEVSE